MGQRFCGRCLHDDLEWRGGGGEGWGLPLGRRAGSGSEGGTFAFCRRSSWAVRACAQPLPAVPALGWRSQGFTRECVGSRGRAASVAGRAEARQAAHISRWAHSDHTSDPLDLLRVPCQPSLGQLTAWVRQPAHQPARGPGWRAGCRTFLMSASLALLAGPGSPALPMPTGCKEYRRR